MANTLDARRSCAHWVAKVDMCCFGIKTLSIVLGLLLGLWLGNERESGENLVAKVLTAVIILVLEVVDFYAITRLLKASSTNNSVSVETAFNWCLFWFYLNSFCLIVGVMGELFAVYVTSVDSRQIYAFIAGVLVRLFMIWIVKKYMDALEERIFENLPTYVQKGSECQDDVV